MQTTLPESTFGGIPLPERADPRHPFVKLLGLWRRHLWLAALVMLAELLKHGLVIASAVVSATLVGMAVVGRPLAELVPWAWALAYVYSARPRPPGPICGSPTTWPTAC